MISGFVLLDKKVGISSARALYQIKDILPKKHKVGHAGTLDPFASGLLIVGVGKATKAIEYVMNMNKTYEFTIKWGEERDTGDITGNVLRNSTKIPSLTEIEAALPELHGLIMQKPPKYSAIKVGGRRAYDLARNGVDFDLNDRIVRVDDLVVTEHCDTQTNFVMQCGKGCYVRSIAEDLASKVGTYGHVTALRRTRIGKLDVSKASLNIISVPDVLGYPKIHVDDDIAQKLLNGIKLEVSSTERFVIINDRYKLLCIGDFSEGELKIKRIEP